MKFSSKAFVVTFLLHVGVTVLLVLVGFGIAMSSFNGPGTAAQDDMHAIDDFGWVWFAGPMLLQRVFHVPVSLFGDLCWSALVGILAGFAVGYLFPKRQPTKRS